MVGLSMNSKFAIWWLGLAGVWLCTASVAPGFAAERYRIASAGLTLSARSGPGAEYTVVSRLPHGTSVVLHERQGDWARITLRQGTQEAWVLSRYLTPQASAPAKPPADMSRQQERRRFARLRRKGVLEVQRSKATGVLQLTMNPLLWHRLAPYVQANFLRRARLYFGGSVVEMRNKRNNALLARLTASGEMEIVAASPAAQPPPASAMPASPPPDLPVTGRPDPAR